MSEGYRLGREKVEKQTGYLGARKICHLEQVRIVCMQDYGQECADQEDASNPLPEASVQKEGNGSDRPATCPTPP